MGFLLFEDILFLGVIFAFLSLKQRAYTILAMVLLLVLILTNFLSLRGNTNVLVVVFPAIACFLVGMFARFFMKRPHITFGGGVARIVIGIFLLLILAFIILSLGIFFHRH